MNDRQTRTLRTFQEIVLATQHEPARFGREGAAIVAHFARTFEELYQLCHAREVAAIKHRGRAPRLYVEGMRQEHMIPLARMGKRLFAGDGSITSALAIPHKRASNDEIFTAADRMVKILRPHRTFLVASGADGKRITLLHAEVRRVRAIVRAAEGATADRAATTRRITELFASARRDILALDGLVLATRDKGAIRYWKQVIKIGGHIGRPKQSRRSARKQAVS